MNRENVDDIWVQLPIHVNPFTGMVKVSVEGEDDFITNEHDKILQLIKEILKESVSFMKKYVKEELSDAKVFD